MLRDTTQNTCSRNTSDPSRPSRRSQVSSSAARSHSIGFQLRSSAAAPGSRLLFPGNPSCRSSPPSPEGWEGKLYMYSFFSKCLLLLGIVSLHAGRVRLFYTGPTLIQGFPEASLLLTIVYLYIYLAFTYISSCIQCNVHTFIHLSPHSNQPIDTHIR